MKKLNVAVVGASGFTGSEICRLLLQHKNIKKIYPVSRERKKFSITHPNLLAADLSYITIRELYKISKKLDCVFLCTKSDDSYDLTAKLLKKNIKIIDLSGAFRFEDIKKYKRAYGSVKINKFLMKKKKAYGITELNRKNILNADIIANPGCYAITALLSLAPIIKKDFLDIKQPISINAINGTTGAGNSPKVDVTHANATENILTYNAEGHRHAPEIEDKLKSLFNKNFLIDLNTAHGNFRRGIYLRININIKKKYINKINRDLLIKIFKNFYDKKNKNNQFIQILDYKKKLKKNDKEYNLYPSIVNVVGSNNCLIGLDYDSDIGIMRIIATTDNLIKGAAGSAIQNMNIIFGCEESESLPKYGIF
jgi:N-acetyl-gamma-glutamyl-phosphate reductase common form